MKWRTKNLLKILVVGMILIMIPQVIHATELAVEPNDLGIDSQSYTTEVATNSEDNQNNPETIELSDGENVQDDVNTEDSENQKETASEDPMNDSEAGLADEALGKKEPETVEETIENATDVNANSEVEKNENEESKESKDPKPETISDKPTAVNEEADTNRALNKNEIIVTSYAELKRLIENKGNGVYDTYYLGADIETQDGGISVPAGYSFILDGTDPITEVRHTMTDLEKKSYSSSDTIRNINGTLITIHLRNIDLIGNSTYGFVYTMNANSTQIYENVSYIGPVFAYNSNGKTIVKNSNFEQISPLKNQFFYRGNHLIIEGNTEFNSFDNGVLTAMNMSSGSVTVSPNATFTFNSDRNAMTVKDLVIASGGTLNLNAQSSDPNKSITGLAIFTNLFINNGVMNVTSDENVTVTQLITASTSNLQNAEINVEFSNSRYPLVFTNGLVAENSLIEVKGDKMSASGAAISAKTGSIDLMDSTVNINVMDSMSPAVYTDAPFLMSNSHLNIEGEEYGGSIIAGYGMEMLRTSSLKIVLSEGVKDDVLKFDDMFIVQNSNVEISIAKNAQTVGTQSIVNAVGYYLSDLRMDAYINDSQINTVFKVGGFFSYEETGEYPAFLSIRSTSDISIVGGNNVNGTILTHQMNAWDKYQQIDVVPTDKQMPSARATSSSGRAGTVQFWIDGQGKVEVTKNELNVESSSIQLSNIKMFSMGYLTGNFDFPEKNTQFSGQTFPGAGVRLNYNKDSIAEGYADEDGKFNLTLSPAAKGDKYKGQIFWNHLYLDIEVDYSHLGSLELVEYPSNLNFGQLLIPQSHQIFNRQDSMRLVVEDTRNNAVGWKLEARLVNPMSDVLGVKPALEDSIIFKPNAQAQPQVLTSDPMLIATQSGTYDSETVITFDVDEGFLLELYGAGGVYKDVTYGTQIEWILTPLS